MLSGSKSTVVYKWLFISLLYNQSICLFRFPINYKHKLYFRWRNYIIRFIFTFIMISGFGLIIYGGPLALMITVSSGFLIATLIFFSIKPFFKLQTLLVQVKCFEEIISIGYQVYRIHGLPWFRSLSWYFLLTSNYFFYGENLVNYFGVVINRVVSLDSHIYSKG